mgnify:FL=1|tara:strand:- start:5137 stop:6171 length:1035 start_codon:yes stop_codon:yes gene_type:complete
MASIDTAGAIAGQSAIAELLSDVIGTERTQFALSTLVFEPSLHEAADLVSRAQLAIALNAALFVDLLDRVPTAARYVAQCRAAGEGIVFDHGALRTVAGETGALPSGHDAFGRFLEPMGYEVGGLYPLPRLTMTGRAYVHKDMPAAIPQFFVSELHVDQLPQSAQDAATRIFSGSQDPLGDAEWRALDALAANGAVPLDEAVVILRGALRAFDRQHPAPALADYEALLEHSKEGAWIATEGNAFNHATTRVPDVVSLADSLKAQGYPLKEAVEHSANGRVHQTALIADKVERPFVLADGSTQMREVPGSFYEFITRDVDPEEGTLDLTFDSGNATGIFAVTRSA